MTTTVIDTKEDLDWLFDVHEIPTEGYKLAILYGNESSPYLVEVFEEDSIECTPRAYVLDDTTGRYMWKNQPIVWSYPDKAWEGPIDRCDTATAAYLRQNDPGAIRSGGLVETTMLLMLAGF